MKILIIYPTPYEAGAFFQKYAGKKPVVGARASAKLGVNDVETVVSGYGCASAVERIKKVAEELKPDLALLCGFCGSCSPDIKKCDYLYDTDSALLKSVFESMGAAPTKIATSETFAGYAEKQNLFRDGYCAVDMEHSLFIGHFGEDKFGAFRCVSDELESNVPEDFFHLLIDKETGGNKPVLGAVAKLFFKNPADIFRLMGFASGSRRMKAEYDAKALALAEKLGSLKPDGV